LGRFSQALPRGLRFAHASRGRTPDCPSATVLRIRRDPLNYLVHADLREVGTIRWYGPTYALDDLIVYVNYAHKREHCAQMRRWRMG